jgi:hypothetical protein
MRPQDQNKDREKTREERLRDFLLEHMAQGGTKAVSLDTAGVALLGLAMTRIADAIERADQRDWAPEKQR